MTTAEAERAPARLVTSVVAIPERRRLLVRWELEPDPGREAASYEVSLGVDGQYLTLPPAGPDPVLELSHRAIGQSVAVEVALRVVAIHTDGGAPTTAEGRFTIPPLHELPPADAWQVGAPEVIVDDAARRAAGLDFWVDGCIGAARVGDEVHAFAANGPHVAHWCVTDGAFLGPVIGAAITIEGSGGAYAAGGPVLVDPDTGQLVLVYHGEEHPHSDPSDFWSFLGLAVSRDGGRTFRDLGRVVTPELALDAHRASSLVEVGGGACVRVGDHLHVYFREARADGRWLALSVARAPLAELFSEASAGRAVAFSKFHEGSWSQPGLGGASTDLLPGAPVPRWFDVALLADHGTFVLVSSDGLSRRWTTLVRASADGIGWGPPQRLLPETDDAELLYCSLLAPTASPGGSAEPVAGDELHLVRTRNEATGAHRWDHAVLERIRLRYRPA